MKLVHHEIEIYEIETRDSTCTMKLKSTTYTRNFGFLVDGDWCKVCHISQDSRIAVNTRIISNDNELASMKRQLGEMTMKLEELKEMREMLSKLQGSGSQHPV